MPATKYGPLHDLTKAYDTISRDERWEIMARFGCPVRFIEMVRQLHDGSRMMENFLNKRSPARLCTGTDTVQHGVLRHAYRCFQDCDDGFPISYRFDGKLFNLRLHAKSKV